MVFYPQQVDGQKDARQLFRDYVYPAMANMIVLALYNMVDRIFIGQGAGPLAICGLALTLPCVALLGTVGTLTGAGAAARIMTAMGAGDRRFAAKVLGNALALNAALSAVLVAVSLAWLDEILLAFGASEATVPYARQYLQVLIPGSLVGNLNFTFCHAIRASGFARRSMGITVAGVVANMVLDPVFIFGFGMGIRGAAIATVLSMGVSSALIARHFLGWQNPLRLRGASFKPHVLTLLSVIGIGMAPFIMNITTGMVNIIMNRYLVNHGGDYAIGAYGIISCYSILVSMLLMGICQGMQPIVGYYYGHGKRRQARETLNEALRLGSVVAGTGFIMGEVFAPALSKCFTWDARLAGMAAEGLRYTFLAMPVVGFQIVATSYFQSIRQAPKAIVMNISRQFVFLIPALGWFSARWGLTGIWLAIPFADVMAVLIALFFIRREERRQACSNS